MRFTPLTRNGEFTRAYKRGETFVHPFLVTYVFKRKGGRGVRVGITTGKKTGGAVARARARRIIRAAAAQVLPQGAGSFDIVFVARAATPTQKSTALIPVIKKHLEKAGVLQNDR